MREGNLMMKRRALICGLAFAGLLAVSSQAQTDSNPSPNFKVFLCFGQSNMSGGNNDAPDSISRVTHPNIRVLAFQNCTASDTTPARTYNEWYQACEPMHCGDGMNNMGPSYAFGTAIADSFPNDTIGLVPCGLWACDIEKFMKNHTVPTACGPTLANGPSTSANAYSWMLAKCQLAQRRGIFTGIILHQGESNSGQANWPFKVDTIYKELKADLGLTQDVPLVAGELLQVAGGGQTPCCASMNVYIDSIPHILPLGYVASSAGLKPGGSEPQYHFDDSSYHVLGQRYATQMMLGLAKVVSTVKPSPRQIVSVASVISQRDNARIYTLDGKFIATGTGMLNSKSLRAGLYVVVNKATGVAAKMMVLSNTVQ